MMMVSSVKLINGGGVELCLSVDGQVLNTYMNKQEMESFIDALTKGYIAMMITQEVDLSNAPLTDKIAETLEKKVLKARNILLPDGPAEILNPPTMGGQLKDDVPF